MQCSHSLNLTNRNEDGSRAPDEHGEEVRSRHDLGNPGVRWCTGGHAQLASRTDGRTLEHGGETESTASGNYTATARERENGRS